jgi:hypothetical protein
MTETEPMSKLQVLSKYIFKVERGEIPSNDNYGSYSRLRTEIFELQRHTSYRSSCSLIQRY